jgi:hypothetical protein
LLRERVGRVFTKNNHFAGIHVFTPSPDVPDEFGLGPRLVVLPPSAGYRRQDDAAAVLAATEVLEKRGDVPRLKRNRLVFLAPDGDAVQRAAGRGADLAGLEIHRGRRVEPPHGPGHLPGRPGQAGHGHARKTA